MRVLPSNPTRPCLLLAGFLFAALTAFALPPAPAEAGVRALHTGVSYVYDNDVAAFENARRTGSQLVQTPLRWASVAPAKRPTSWNPQDPADPHYDWEEIDLWVARAAAAGLTPILQVRGAPLWAQRCPSSETDAPCNPDPDALAEFTTAAVRRYSGAFGGLPHVQYWQGLNEPNLSLFFNPQFEGDRPVSPDLYRTLINRFYAAVKAVDPSNLVIAAGLGPIAVPKYTIGPMRFTRLLLCMRGHKKPRPAPGDCEGGVHFDIFDMHPYTTGGPTHEGGVNDVQLGDLAKLKTLLAAADRAGRIQGAFEHTPLWIMEFSWDSNPPDPGGLPMKIESRWTAEALYQSWKAGVEYFFWYSLRDPEPEPDIPFSQTLSSGLYFRGADRRPGPAQGIPLCLPLPLRRLSDGKRPVLLGSHAEQRRRRSHAPGLEGESLAQAGRDRRQQRRNLQGPDRPLLWAWQTRPGSRRLCRRSLDPLLHAPGPRFRPAAVRMIEQLP